MNKVTVGSRFGRWTVMSRSSKRKVICRCDCGTVREVYKTNLTAGKSISCGCSRQSGVEGTKLYNIWSSMKSRCLNLNHHAYKDYGGRGIKVCNEWVNDVLAFYNWSIENGYREGLTIDRIDNDKGYSPDNCRWVTQLEQDNNKRNNLLITYNGKTQSVSQWGRELGINNRTILSRIRAGWETEDLFKPVRRKQECKKAIV